jgi:SynChlorMet cassette radical SAM/SPASM protein ScmF
VRLDILKAAIFEAKSLGLESVKLTGGEPLLYKELPELLDFLSSENLSIYVETNGTLIDQRMGEALRDSKTEQVSVSLDAAASDLHDKIRGKIGSFGKVLAGLAILSNYGVSFQIIMTLQGDNRGEIGDVITLSERLGADSLKINPLIPCGRAEALFENRGALSLDELLKLYRSVEKEWSPSANLEILFDLPPALRSLEEIKRRGLDECKVLNILGVLANGDMSLCGIGETMDELRLGNISGTSISQVWQQSTVLKDLRASIPGKLRGICGKCIFKFQCLGACRANAYNMTRDFYAPYFLCQEMYESGRFPTSRCI